MAANLFEPSARIVSALPNEEILGEVDRRLGDALRQACSSALGMPSAVDTFKTMLERAGLALVLIEELRP
ncbi:hypothetical protein SAMN05216337_1001214 [Bradyrhizobium brasilense]|uniref:Uncharacterized protein n=1 Tax=Bradyrhizobium brasilense TaxID=1419277 RepID=A0A1G6IPJ3_9BRAD|nr:hypothetical protein [Bradyrhizobium brasilense]SDC08419.1 hypothetical protein SAMN05216337_1001214 [Bradyrhizobium brasilense]